LRERREQVRLLARTKLETYTFMRVIQGIHSTTEFTSSASGFRFRVPLEVMNTPRELSRLQ